MGNARVTKSIIVKTRFRTVHCYKNAPRQVSFLKALHSHQFEVSAELPIKEDRGMEYFIVECHINESILPMINMVNKNAGYTLSCEDMAEKIARRLMTDYGVKWCEVIISEDGNHGSRVKVS